MGITTQYLRYVPGSVFGLVATSPSVSYFARFSQKDKYVVTGACEQLIVWDVKRGEKFLTFVGQETKGTVTTFKVRPPYAGSIDNTHIAAGYSDGSVVVFDVYQSQPLHFSGHKGGITSLEWNDVGLLASGSEDGEIVVWDVGAERGVVRFRGHKGSITQVRFLKSRNVLVSSSKDRLVKFWDLDTNHCFRTLSDHTKEVWDFVLLKNDSMLVTGSSDFYLRVWQLEFKNAEDKSESNNPENPTELPAKLMRLENEKVIPENEDEIINDASILGLKNIGYIERSCNDRVMGLKTDGKVLACYSKKKIVEFYRILSDDEVQSKFEKRIKKMRKRLRDNECLEETPEVGLIDIVRKLSPLKISSPLRHIDFVSLSQDLIKIAVLHADNRIAIYSPDKTEPTKTNEEIITPPKMKLEIPGHRSEIRAVAYNSIGDQIFTGSGESIKIWDRMKQKAVMTLSSDYVVSMIVPPGDRHVVIGTNSGNIQLYDIGSGTQLENVQGHQMDESNTDSGVWGLAILPDGRGFVSGGSDSLVHFWKFELVQNEGNNEGKRLSFIQDTRALKVADQVTSLKCSKGGKFLAVATLDLKETIYFLDTLKLNNELYGKSLPATCMDFAADESMLVVGSKDSCIRIFGTDFGDQKRLFKNAHQGGVSTIQFVSKTHLFFSSGNDGCIKQWDADNFQHIVTLKGHSGIVRCLSVCPKGAWVVSCGQDHSIRLWERTQEPLILEEEREEERRRDEEESGVTATQRPVVEGENMPGHAVRPTMSSHLTDQAADRIIEAIDIYEDQVLYGDKAVPNQLMNLVFNTNDPHRFLIEVLRKIRATEIEEAILLLPFNYILKLLKGCLNLLQRNYDVELTARIIIVASRVHLPQILASTKASAIIRDLATTLPVACSHVQDEVGFNLAGLNHMKSVIEQRSEVQFFAEATDKVKKNKKRRKKKLASEKRAALLIV